MWMHSAVMMVAMMLPSLVPVLRRHRRPVVVGATYLAVWALAGIVLAEIAMRVPALSRAVPVVVVLAGLLQFTRWKAHHLACFRDMTQSDGFRLALHCGLSCGNLMLISLVLGMMDLRVMAAVTAAITCERLIARPRVVQAIGVLAVAVGLVLLTRTLECSHPCSENRRSSFACSSPQMRSHSIHTVR